MDKQPNSQRPARPPQILLDQFQRPVAVAPGFSKLEAVALALLPVYIKMRQDRVELVGNNGDNITPIEAAFQTAEIFCQYVDDLEAKPQTDIIDFT